MEVEAKNSQSNTYENPENVVNESNDQDSKQIALETQQSHIDVHEESKEQKSAIREKLIQWFREAINSKSYITVTDEIYDLIKGSSSNLKQCTRDMQWILMTLITSNKSKAKNNSNEIVSTYTNVINTLRQKFPESKEVQKLIYENIVFL